MQKERGFALLKPRVQLNAKSMAKAIAMCDGVREVFLTSGEYGFVAIIEANASQGIHKIGRMIERVGRGVKVSMIIKHYAYRKK